MMASIVGFAGLAWQWRQAEGRRQVAECARDDAIAGRDLAEQGLYVSRVGQAHEHARTGQIARAAELLRLCQPHSPRPDRRGWEWYYLNHFCETGRDPVQVLPLGSLDVPKFGVCERNRQP